MRLRLAVAVVVALALPLSAGAAPAFKATFRAAGHAPKVNVKWPWRVKVTSPKGTPVVARITVQIVDPFGGVHPVQFDCCRRDIVDHRIRGVFRDKVKFPPEARGYRLTFRVTVKGPGGVRVLGYRVRAR